MTRKTSEFKADSSFKVSKIADNLAEGATDSGKLLGLGIVDTVKGCYMLLTGLDTNCNSKQELNRLLGLGFILGGAGRILAAGLTTVCTALPIPVYPLKARRAIVYLDRELRGPHYMHVDPEAVIKTENEMKDLKESVQMKDEKIQDLNSKLKETAEKNDPELVDIEQKNRERDALQRLSAFSLRARTSNSATANSSAASASPPSHHQCGR